MGPLLARKKVEGDKMILRCGAVRCREVIAWAYYEQDDIYMSVTIPDKYTKDARGVFVENLRAAKRDKEERDWRKTEAIGGFARAKFIENGQEKAIQSSKDIKKDKTTHKPNFVFRSDFASTIIRCAQCQRLSKIFS